jgi:hypothetical protein
MLQGMCLPGLSSDDFKIVRETDYEPRPAGVSCISSSCFPDIDSPKGGMPLRKKVQAFVLLTKSTTQGQRS